MSLPRSFNADAACASTHARTAIAFLGLRAVVKKFESPKSAPRSATRKARASHGAIGTATRPAVVSAHYTPKERSTRTAADDLSASTVSSAVNVNPGERYAAPATVAKTMMLNEAPQLTLSGVPVVISVPI